MNKALSKNGIKLGKYNIKYLIINMNSYYRLYEEIINDGYGATLIADTKDRCKLKNLMNRRINNLRIQRKYY